MTEKRIFPLNYPLQEKPLPSSTPGIKNISKPVVDVDGRDRGVSKGGKERVKPAEAIFRCEMCGRKQKVVFSVGRPPEWHRCIKCNELQPMDGYHVVMYGRGLPRVLTDNEIKARTAELEGQRR